MLSDVNSKPSPPSMYSCKSFITETVVGFKDKAFLLLLNIDQYFVRPVLFFEHIINMQDKTQMQEPDTAHTSQLSSLDTLLMMNIGEDTDLG